MNDTATQSLTEAGKPAPAKAPVDLAAFDTTAASNRGTEIELQHPVTRAGLGVFFGIVGKDSDVFRDTVRSNVDQRIRRETFAARRNKPVDPATSAQAERDTIELLAACTTHWRTGGTLEDSAGSDPTITLGGETMTFTPANALRVYETQLWVRRQIDDAIGELENFMKG